MSAKETCSAEQLYDRTCEFYKKNSDKEFLTTSNGQKYRNPLYAPNQEAINKLQDASKGNSNSGGTIATKPYGTQQVDQSAHMDQVLELQMDSENILFETEIRKWPKKTQRALSSPFFLPYILRSAYPDEKAFSYLHSTPIYAPKPFSDPNAKMAALDEKDVEDLKKAIGTANLKKLRTTYVKYAEKMLPNPYQNLEQVPPKPERPMETPANIAKNKKRIEKLFQYTQEQMIVLIKNGRSDAQLSPEQKSMIKKIETLKYVHSSDNRNVSDGICKDPDQAFYIPLNHYITACENTQSLPDSQLVLVLAHEMGHSIDPCVSKSALHQINQGNLDHVLTQQQASKDDNASEESKRLSEWLNYFKKVDSAYINGLNDQSLDSSTEKTLIEMGVITKAANPIPESKYPFESVRSCLINHENFDDISDSDIEAEISYMKSYMKRVGKPLAKKDELQVEAHYKKNKSCAGTGLKKTELNEAMCDFHGSFVQAKYLNDFPPKNEVDAFAAMSLFSKYACGQSVQIQGEAINAMAALNHSHPQSFRRIQSVFFKMPGIADHFGCELKPKSKCFVNQEHLLSKKSNSSNKEAGQK